MNRLEQDRSTVKNWKWLREIVDEACQPIGPYWPMKTFAYYNPIRDLEHLPFARAIEEANQLLGAKGFLSVEEYRQFFYQGRITLPALERALRRVGPSLPSRDTIRVGARTIHVQDVWRIHAVYGIEILPAVLMTWTLELEGLTTRFRSDLPEDSRSSIIDRTIRECEKCRHDPESAYLHNLWKSSLAACQLSDPVSGLPSFHASDRIGSAHASEHESALVPVDLPMDRTLGDWLDRETGSVLVETINTHMIKWIGAFVDEGVAGWSMPSRDKGFYAAWRELAEGDLSGKFLGIPDLRQKFGELSDAPEETLCIHLQNLKIPKERWQNYLSRHLAQLPGWAGFIRWRSDHTGYPAQQHYPIDPLQYLAVRLFYESGMVEGLCQREWGIKGTLPALIAYWNEQREPEQGVSLPFSHATDPNNHAVCHQAWRLFHLAQFLELTPIEVHELSYTDMSTLLEWLDLFPQSAHGPVWLEAYEDVYREYLLRNISGHQGVTPVCNERPRAQGIFCIDARSESFRRHLEAQGAYETFGYAGFFGVPMSHVAFDSHDHLALCPILLTPNAEVTEVPRLGQNDRVKDYLSGTRWHQLSHHLFHDLKHNPLASFMMIDVLGMFFSVGLVGKTLFRTSFDAVKQWLQQWLGGTVATQIPVEPSCENEQGNPRLGSTGTRFHPIGASGICGGGIASDRPHEKLWPVCDDLRSWKPVRKQSLLCGAGLWRMWRQSW